VRVIPVWPALLRLRLPSKLELHVLCGLMQQELDMEVRLVPGMTQ
jgi:hypothetical protein